MTIDAVLFGIASVLFLAASILSLRPLKSAFTPQPWQLLAGTFFTLALAFGIRFYQRLAPPGPLDLVVIASALMVLAGLLACLAAFVFLGEVAAARQGRTDLFEEVARFRQSFDKDPHLMAIKDRQSAYQAVNPAFAQFLGKTPEMMIGKSDFDFFPRSQANAFKQEEEKVMENSLLHTATEELRGAQGVRQFRLTRAPLAGADKAVLGVLLTAEDITIQRELEQSLLTYKQGLAALHGADLALFNPKDPGLLRLTILSWAGKLAGTSHAAFWQVSSEKNVLTLVQGSGKLETCTGVSLQPGEDIAGKALQSGQVILANDYPAWPERAPCLAESGFIAALAIPVKTGTQVDGVLTLYHDRPGAAFTDEQVTFLGLYSQAASAGLQNAGLYANRQGELDERSQHLKGLQYRLRLEHVVATMSAHFIGIDSARIGEGIDRALQTIARFAGVERAYLVLFASEGKSGEVLASFPNGLDDLPGGVGPDQSSGDFQWFFGRLNQLESIHIPNRANLAPELEEAAAYLERRGVLSYTAIPLVASRALVGYLSFETRQSILEWSPEILALLRISAEMFVNLLERRSAAGLLQESQEKVRRQIHNLEQRGRENALITELGDLLQACRTADEAYPLLARNMLRLLPVASGALYMFHDSHDPAENVVSWGNAPPGAAERELVSNECWALRRGRLHAVSDPQSEPFCGHIKETLPAGYLCVPLLAQGVAVGILHLRRTANIADGPAFSEEQQRLATRVAEYVALALTNLNLRDNLRSQAIRDPLTGLFNRRYMEETLEREIRRASRHNTTVGVIMFDIDRMKPINDRYGHDAGDMLLRSLGNELMKMFRGEDVACRYGGDEFTIVLPEASLADVWRRAEQMRDAVKKMEIQYEGNRLEPVTLSTGVAAYPDHGLTGEKVLLASDAASYASKQEGGDRIMMGHEVET